MRKVIISVILFWLTCSLCNGEEVERVSYILPQYKLERVDSTKVILSLYDMNDSIELRCPIFKINEDNIAGANIKSFIDAVDSIESQTFILWNALIQPEFRYTYTDFRLKSSYSKRIFKWDQPFIEGVALTEGRNGREIPILIISRLEYYGPLFDQYFLPTNQQAIIKSAPTPPNYINFTNSAEFFFRQVVDYVEKQYVQITDLYLGKKWLKENGVNLMQDSIETGRKETITEYIEQFESLPTKR